MNRTDADLLLTNGRVLQSSGESARHTAIAISGPNIVDIGTTNELTAQYCATQIIDCAGAIIHAGLIEPHLHLLSLPFLGVGLDALGISGSSYSDIKTAVNQDATRCFARYAAMTLLQQGFTTVCEPGTAFETAALADGLQEGGINALISAPYCWDDLDMFAQAAPGLVSDTVLQRAPASTDRCLAALESTLEIADSYGKSVQGFICLYGLGSASDVLIREAKVLARRHNVLFNLHQDYTLPLREGEIAQHGASGTRRLDRLEALDGQTSLTHMVYSSHDDFALVAGSGAGVIWCPLNILQRGYFRDATHHHVKGLRDGVPVSIAADTGLTFPSSAATTAAQLLAAGQNTPLSNIESLKLQTNHAATCLGIGDQTGRLSPGMRADVVVRAPQAPLSNGPSADEIAGLAFAMPVDVVIAAGRVVVEGGRYTAGNLDDSARETALHRARLLDNANG